MKNNIKKAPVKFWEDLLYFQHFMQIFVFFLQISDYHHLKGRPQLRREANMKMMGVASPESIAIHLKNTKKCFSETSPY